MFRNPLNKSVDPDFFFNVCIQKKNTNAEGRKAKVSEENFKIHYRKVNKIDPNRFFILDEWYKVQLGNLRSISNFSHRSRVSLKRFGIGLELGDHKKARSVSVQGSMRTV